MSAFGDGDRRTEIYDLLVNLREHYDVRPSRVIAMALEAVHLFAEELADARDRAEESRAPAEIGK